jgi:aminoglycoside 6'-N-acetyltransferase
LARTRDHPVMNTPRLIGDRVTLRALEDTDRARLRSILAEPSVAQWWGPQSPDEAVDELFAPDEAVFAIEVGGAVVGGIWVSEEDEPDYRHAGIDLFLDAAHQGQGLGPEAIRLVARYLFEARGHHRLTIDPAAANERAIRAYERVGFRPVGVMRQYERGHDGTWHDGLLMDLLAGELREPKPAGEPREREPSS